MHTCRASSKKIIKFLNLTDVPLTTADSHQLQRSRTVSQMEVGQDFSERGRSIGIAVPHKFQPLLAPWLTSRRRHAPVNGPTRRPSKKDSSTGGLTSDAPLFLSWCRSGQYVSRYIVRVIRLSLEINISITRRVTVYSSYTVQCYFYILFWPHALWLELHRFRLKGQIYS